MFKRFYGLFTTLAWFTMICGVALSMFTPRVSAATYSVPETAEVRLSWDPNVPAPDGYRIYQRKAGQAYDYSQPVWTGSATSGMVYNLEYDTPYYFVARAYVGSVDSVDSEEVTYTAARPTPVTFSISATGCEHGAISPAGTTEAVEGSDQAYTITAHNSCSLVDVIVDGESKGAITAYTFENIAAHHTIAATFVMKSYPITATAGEGGSISPAGVRTLNHGATQRYTITAATGYHVADVNVDGVSVGPVNAYTFNWITAQHSIHAIFEADTVLIRAEAGENGSITPAGTTEVKQGGNQTYAITADHGYRIADVRVDGQSVGATTSYTFSDITGAHTIEASFAAIRYVSIQIEAEDGDLTVPMEIRDDAKASAGGYVWVPTGSQDTSGVADYRFAVQDAGDYVIWGRTASSDGTGDSFLVSIDGLDAMVWHTKRDGKNVWTWDVVSERAEADPRDTSDPKPFFLTAGTHTLRIKQREAGAKLDKIMITNQTDMISPVNQAAVEAMEFGDVEVNHKWTRVDFSKAFVNPVVVAGPLSLNGGDPAVIRIQKVDGTGFDIRVQEWDYLDGGHAMETVSYMVMEQGNYTLDDGTKIEAGTLEVSAAQGFEVLSFGEPFNVTPIVMSTLTTYNDAAAVTGRMKQVTTAGFSYRMQEQEANTQDHGPERLSYIAWEPSSGTVGGISYRVEQTGDVVNSTQRAIAFDPSYATAPVFLADMQTADGGDAATVRCLNRNGSSTGILIHEEASRDEEVDHTTEIVGFMVLSQ